MTIRFYSDKGEYGGFSNFSAHPFYLDGERWRTTEHYFQAAKFAGTPHADEVRQCKSPKEAADMGRDRARPLRRDWESVKDDVMRRAIEASSICVGPMRGGLSAANICCCSRPIVSAATPTCWPCSVPG